MSNNINVQSRFTESTKIALKYFVMQFWTWPCVYSLVICIGKKNLKLKLLQIWGDVSLDAVKPCLVNLIHNDKDIVSSLQFQKSLYRKNNLVIHMP